MEKFRTVFLGDKKIQLLGTKPKIGSKIRYCFHAKPARKARSKLTTEQICKGLVIVSTLPNIRSFACSQQVLDLEAEVNSHLSHAKIFHVASDPKAGWEEVDRLHPFLQSPGFTLDGVPHESIESFKQAFGVGVKGNRRVAHGLFALLDGEFLVSYIPRQQYGIPNIKRFIQNVKHALKM